LAIPAFRKLRQEDPKFQASLGYIRKSFLKKKNLANVLNKRANELPSRYYSNESLFILLLK
jgi:hypothetical protein